MTVELPVGINERVESWSSLDRNQRKELCRSLRRAGLTYSEITTLVSVPAGTLSTWVRDVILTTPIAPP